MVHLKNLVSHCEFPDSTMNEGYVVKFKKNQQHLLREGQSFAIQVISMELLIGRNKNFHFLFLS